MKTTVSIVIVLLLGVAIVYSLRPSPVVWERVETIDGETLTLEVNASDGWSASEQWRAHAKDGAADPAEPMTSGTTFGQDSELNLLFSTGTGGGEASSRLSPIIHDEHKAVYYFPTSRLIGTEGRLWVDSGTTGYTFRINGTSIEGSSRAGDGRIRYYFLRNRARASAEQAIDSGS